MHTDKIDSYFKSKGVKVIYNMMGHSEELVRAYVKNFQHTVDSASSKKSQHVKHACYTALYGMKPRQKFTGFEKFKKIDQEFRKNVRPLVTEPQFSPTIIVDPNFNEVSDTYKNTLKNHIAGLNNPLLYLSGGIDSELVALAMLDSGVKFTPVIFNYVNNLGQTINLFDINYAYEFCSNHSLFPVAKTINIEELWQSRDFAELAIDLQIVSPHLVTHAYMVKLMDSVLPGREHVFGGEVRFYTNHQLDDGRMANLVLLAKTAPGYNGLTYSATSFTGVESASQSLTYRNDGTWEVTGTGNTGFSTDSGTWRTAPASTYEYRILSRTITSNAGTTNYVPSGSIPTAWATIGASTGVCLGQASPTSPAAILDITFGIEVRTASGAQQGIVQSSSINFSLEYNA